MLEILFAASADADSAVVRWVYSGGKEWEGLENEVQIICSWITTNTAKYSDVTAIDRWETQRAQGATNIAKNTGNGQLCSSRLNWPFPVNFFEPIF